MIVSAWNPATDNLEKTYLSNAAQAGSNSINVKNADRMPQNSRILIGEMGMEQSEIATVTSGGTSTSIPLSGNLIFAHSADEPIYKLPFDQVLFYRSDSADGIYSLVATVPMDVDNYNGRTSYKDTTGSGGSFYKTKYYNSITSVESVFSDYISAEGYGEQTIGSVVDSTVKRLKDAEYTVLSGDDYLSIATEVNYDISSQSERPYDFTRASAVLDRVAGQNYIQLPQDYYKFGSIEYTNIVGSYPRTKRLNPLDLDNFYVTSGVSTSSDMISRIAIDDTTKRIILSPTPLTSATGAFRLTYYRRLGEFNNLTDTIMTPNTLIYRYKFMSEFYAEKSTIDPSFERLSTRYDQKYGNELMKLQRSNRKDVGTPRSFMDSARTSSSTHSEGRRYVL